LETVLPIITPISFIIRFFLVSLSLKVKANITIRTRV
jgi:hypothetical protein